ncbi:hypothetical protein D1007_17501 [Hordeum vulgare]|nr:hypothetical protein D1007_17501 [Hordeum vulgare]
MSRCSWISPSGLLPGSVRKSPASTSDANHHHHPSHVVVRQQATSLAIVRDTLFSTKEVFKSHHAASTPRMSPSSSSTSCTLSIHGHLPLCVLQPPRRQALPWRQGNIVHATPVLLLLVGRWSDPPWPQLASSPSLSSFLPRLRRGLR